MNNVVSLNNWKGDHPDRVIVSLLYGRTVINITSEDYRTTFKSHIKKCAYVQTEFDSILESFREEYPTAKIVKIIEHTEDDA